MILLIAISAALAQDVPASSGPGAAASSAPVSQARLPQVAYAAPAAYPPAALAEGLEATVLLEVAISDAGQVLDAAVVEPAGYGFDESALDAIRAYQFSPALNADGVSSSAIIRFRIVFEAEAAPVVALQGTLTGEGVPLYGVQIRALGPDGKQAIATTQEDGRFEFVGLAAGPWTVVAEDPDFLPELIETTIEPGVLVQLDIPMEAPARTTTGVGTASTEIVVVAERTSPEITERRLTAEEIRYLPGSSGDVVKAVQNLPGIARAPLGIGQLIVRGNNPEDTLYTLDGSPIPLVFHFAGLTSVVPSDALDEVAYLPGNYGVRYGRQLGGVVDLRTTSKLPETPTRYVSVDLFQSAAFVEHRLGERSAITVSARRSYADAILSPILSSTDTKVQAPRYYDGQIRFQHFGDRGTWDIMGYLSDDRFRFLGVSEDEEEDLTFAAYADQFRRLRVRRLDKVGEWDHEATLAIGPERRFFEFGGASDALEQSTTVSLRQEWSRPLTEERVLGARFGLDALGGKEEFNFYLDGFGEREQDEALFAAPAVYGELSARVGPVTLIPGVRADALAYDTGYSVATVDPRLAARLDATDTTRIKASVGRYSSFPGLREVSERADGNGDLGAEWALQASAGVEQQLPGNLRAEVNFFSNWLHDLVVGREDRLEFFSGPPPVGPFDVDEYANDGVGRTYGVEGQLRYDGERAVGLLTATYSHSERQDRPDEEVELFAYDQPLVLNALWSQELGESWRLGARFRYGSGNPYTPVVNRYFDASRRDYVPVYGERSSARLSAFKSVDVRVDKTWTFEGWELTGYLELQNATNAKNVEVIAWNFDYSEETPITGYPPLPVFGVRGEW